MLINDRLEAKTLTQPGSSPEPRPIHSAGLALKRIGTNLVESLRTLEMAARNFPDLVWEVGFSGGKDSTVVCHLVFEYISQALVDGSPLPPKVYILYSDTLLDLPILRKHTLLTMEKMKKYSRKFNDLVKVKILKPAQGEDFFTLLVERGYSAPHFRFRWCMDRLKIDPTLDFLSKLGRFAMVSGVRREESLTRKRNLLRRRQTKPIEEVGGVTMVAPLLNWNTKDIWDFLLSFRQPWSGESYQELFEIYRMGDNLEGCGRCMLTPNSRFGCWVCTVVRRDRLLQGLAENGQKYRAMLEAKEKIRKISLTPSMRDFGPDGRYKGLNIDGRFEVVNVLAEVILTANEALEGYMEDPKLRNRLISWLEESYKRSGNPRLKQALDLLNASYGMKKSKPSGWNGSVIPY